MIGKHLSCRRMRPASRVTVFIWASLYTLLLVHLRDTNANIFGKRKSPVQKDYDLLNNLLVEQLVDNDNPVDDLILALDWLKHTTDKTAPPSDRSPKKVPRTEALVLFTSLLQLMDPGKPLCDLTAMNILEKNEQACGIELMVPRSELPKMRRIEDVIHQVASLHAKACRYEHPARFSDALKRADKLKIDVITGILNAVIETSKMPVFNLDNRDTDKRNSLRQKSMSVSWKGQDEAMAALNALRQIVPEAHYLSKMPDMKNRDKTVVMVKKIKKILEDHLFSNCHYVMEDFYSTIAPASLSENLFPDDFKYRAIDDSTGDLMIWIRYYAMCQDLIEDNRNDFEKNIIKAIKDDK